MDDVISMRVAELGDWIRTHNGNVPKRSSDDPTEKRLGAFLANLRTSKKNAEAGQNRKPMFWSDAYLTILRNKSVDVSILDGSNVYLKKNVARLKKILTTISNNGENANTPDALWISNMRTAKMQGKKKWNQLYQETLDNYNETADVKVRENLFDVTYQEHRGISTFKGVLDRMKERKEQQIRFAPEVGISREYEYAPRNHALRYMKRMGTELSELDVEVLTEEQNDASLISSLRQAKKNANKRTFRPVYDEMCASYGFPNLLNSVDTKKSS